MPNPGLGICVYRFEETMNPGKQSSRFSDIKLKKIIHPGANNSMPGLPYHSSIFHFLFYFESFTVLVTFRIRFQFLDQALFDSAPTYTSIPDTYLYQILSISIPQTINFMSCQQDFVMNEFGKCQSKKVKLLWKPQDFLGLSVY